VEPQIQLVNAIQDLVAGVHVNRPSWLPFCAPVAEHGSALRGGRSLDPSRSPSRTHSPWRARSGRKPENRCWTTATSSAPGRSSTAWRGSRRSQSRRSPIRERRQITWTAWLSGWSRGADPSATA